MQAHRGVVCVTGATGYLAGHVIAQLLERGYTVHATMRDVKQTARVAHLTSLPGASERLKLFAADLSQPGSFDAPVSGSDAVMHIVSPCDGALWACSLTATQASVVQIQAEDPVRDIIEPSVNGIKTVLASIEKAASVATLVLTSSYAAVEVGVPSEPRGPVTEEDRNTDASPQWKVCHFCPPPPSLHLLPLSQPYAFSKVEAERHCIEWVHAQERGGRKIK